MSTIGFIGTGIMGRHMATHLQAGGHELYLCRHRSPLPEELLAGGAVACGTRREVAESAEVLIFMVPDTRLVIGICLIVSNLRLGVVDFGSLISYVLTRQFGYSIG